MPETVGQPVYKITRLADMKYRASRMALAARCYAKVAGYTGEQSGWIYDKENKTVCQGWVNFTHNKAAEVLDWLSQEITGHKFQDLLRAAGNYRPTLRADLDWRCVPLAEAYDDAQRRRGDPRRAETYGFHVIGDRILPAGPFSTQVTRDFETLRMAHAQDRLDEVAATISDKALMDVSLALGNPWRGFATLVADIRQVLDANRVPALCPAENA